MGLRLAFPLRYRALIEAEAARHGFDPLLVAALVYVESRYDPYAVSAQGARGLMQVMPDTGSWVAQRMGMGPLDPDDLFIPEVNVRIGVWYLAELRRTFNGDQVLMLSAYNAGAGNVQEWVRRHPDVAYGRSLDERLSAIPFPETRAFVRRVMLTHAVYRWLYDPFARSR